MYVIANPLAHTVEGDDFIRGARQDVHITTDGSAGCIQIDGVTVPGVIGEDVVLKPGDARTMTTLTVTFLVGEVRIDDDVAALTGIQLPVGSDSGVYFEDDDATRPFSPIDLDALDAEVVNG